MFKHIKQKEKAMNISPVIFSSSNAYKYSMPHVSARDAYNLPSGITLDSQNVNYYNAERLSTSQLFDIQYASSTKLSDGAVLIRPVILSMGRVDIEPSPNEEGKYIIYKCPYTFSSKEKPVQREMTEKELVNNRSLCRGKLRKLGENEFKLIFIDQKGKLRKVITDKEGCIKLLKSNLLYI